MDWDTEAEKAKSEWIEQGVEAGNLWPEDGHVDLAEKAWDAAINWVKTMAFLKILEENK